MTVDSGAEAAGGGTALCGESANPGAAALRRGRAGHIPGAFGPVSHRVEGVVSRGAG